MKSYLRIFFLLLFSACEIEDIQVIDLEKELPTREDPMVLESNQIVRLVTLLSTGSIAFVGNDSYTGEPFFGIRLVTGEIQIRETSMQVFNIGSYGDKIVLHDGDIHVYNEGLEWKDTYEGDTDFFTSSYNKVTWGSGTRIHHLSAESGYQSSSLTMEGGFVTFPNAKAIHMPEATYAKLRVDYSTETRFFLAKYDNAFKFLTTLEIENHAPLFSNRSHYYLGFGSWYSSMDIFKYSADGSLVAEVPGYSLPGHKPSLRYEVLDDGNILVFDEHVKLSILSFSTGQELWSLSGVAGYALTEDGRLLVATTANGRIKGNGPNIFLMDPEY